jgi:hypothetical protein
MASFRASYSGIGELLRSPEIEAEMVRRAEKVKAQAEATAPVDSGEYKASFEVHSSRRGGSKKDRASAVVENNDDAAFFVEYGASHTPRYRTLGKALDAAKD